MMTAASYTFDFDSAEAFLDYLRPSRGHWETYVNGKLRWVFRGQRDATWRLLPSAWREDPRSTGEMKGLSNNLGADGLSTFYHLLERCEMYTPSGIAAVNSQSERELRMLQEFIAHANVAGMAVPYASVEIQPQDFGYIAVFQGKEVECPGYEQCFGPFLDVARRSQRIDGGARPSLPLEVLGQIFDLEELREAWPSLTNFTMRNPVAALAQHHGIPTRLLDWSHDSRIAAYFASADVKEDEMNDPDRRIAVFALNPFLLHRDRIDASQLVDFADDPQAARVVLSRHATFVEKAESNSYLAAQAGLFTYPEFADLYRILEGTYPTIDRSIELKIDWKHRVSEEPKPHIKDFIRKMTLPCHEADRLMEMLDDERIFLASLMPSLDQMKQSILARDARRSRMSRRRSFPA